MASALYKYFKQLCLGADIDLENDTIKVSLVDTDTYTYSAAHQFHSDLSGITATSAALTNPTITDGVFDADDVTLSSVSGNVSEALVIWKDTGVSATSPLIAYIDSGTGLPATPNGGDINIVWDSGANKIFAL